MKKYTLSNSTNSVEVSQLAVGHLGIHFPETNKAAEAFMEQFMEFGGTTFDTSRIAVEGQSEIHLGRFIQRIGKRKEMVIATKCGHHDRKYNRPRLDAASIFSDVDMSLTALRTDYIDILYAHRDDLARPVEETMVALDKVVKSGKALVLGASNWSATRLEQANKFALEFGLTPFSVSQINYSAALTTPTINGDVTMITMDMAEKSWYEKDGMLVMPWASNARGFFSQVINNGKANVKTQELYGWCPENFERAKRIEIVANKVGFPVGCVVLAYLLCQNIDVCPVIGFSKQEQFEEAKKALDCHLTRQDILFIEGKFSDFSR